MPAIDPTCIFCRIIRGEIPASVIYRDDLAVAFMDIAPVNPGHLLVAPTAHAASLADLEETSGARLFVVGQRLASALRRSGLPCEGVNLFLADGEAAGQEVLHVHLHVVPRFAGDPVRFSWPRSRPTREALSAHAAAILTIL